MPYYDFRVNTVSIRKMFVPECIYNNIYEINSELLESAGKRGLVFDIDNTVAPYETPRPTKEVKDYFSSLTKAGMQIAFVSNNKNTRTDIFNEELGFFCVTDASKPSPKGVLKCIEYMKLEKSEMLLIGDQIFTDCVAAHRAGIECYLVKPIKDKKTLFFRFKRFFEKPFIRIYNKRKAKRINEKV